MRVHALDVHDVPVYAHDVHDAHAAYDVSVMYASCMRSSCRHHVPIYRGLHMYAHAGP
jgi:hypothetical protein